MSKSKLFLVFLLLACLAFPQVGRAAAVGIGDIQLIPDECREGKAEECDLDSLLQMFVNFAQLLLAGLTIFTLLMFVWGSFGLATSMGNPEKVKGAKDGMVGAIIGMVIVIAAWALTNTMVCLLIASEQNPQCLIFGRPWWGYGDGIGDCREKDPYSSTDCQGSNLYLNCGDAPLTNN
ncbi:pilin, partial [Patescibacteria group bacterium]|nr:pilin [Patescibacteria group bacterium]